MYADVVDKRHRVAQHHRMPRVVEADKAVGAARLAVVPDQVAVCTQCPSRPAAGTYLLTWINAAMWRWLVMWALDE